MDKTYVALYTHQKNKKAKTWQDGLLKVLSTGTKAVLYDEKGSRLDALHLHASDVRPGEQLESDKYYIQVEEECAPLASQSLPAISRDGSSDSSHSLNAASQQEKDKNAQSNMCGGGASRRIVAGLKRKRNGFNPPRLVKPRHPEEPATGSVESYSPHHEQTLLSPRVQKLSSWNAAAQQSSSFEFLMNRSNMIHLPEQHARSLTVSTVPKIFASEGLPGMERMGDAEKEASCLMSPHVSNSNLTTLKKNSPWRVFGSLVSGSIGSSLSQKKEDLPLEKQEDVSSRQLQTEPQVSANLSQFCSEVGIKDNVYMPSALSISDIGIKSFSKKCDQRDQAEVRERFLAWDAEQLKADGPALKRSTAEIMALVQGYGGSSPKKAGPNVWESCSSNRNKAELFSKNELHFKEVEFLPSGTQTKQFSSLPASAFSEHSSSRESSVFRLFQTPAVTVASPFSQNHGDVGCVNAESHLCKKISSPGDSFLDHTMLQKVSNNMLSERNSRSSSSRNSLCFGDLSPVNCLVSSMSGQVSEHSGNLTICDKRLESQSKDIENIIQYQAVLENTVEHGENFILNNDMLENMAKHDENSTQISGVSENTSKHDENLKQKDEVFKNNMKEAPYSQDVALSLPAVSVSSVDPPFSEPCSIFKVGTRIKHEKDNVADLLPQGMRQLEASSQEWHGHHSKLLEHQGDDSKQVCKLLGTTSVVDRDKRNQSLSNSQNKHSIDSSQIKHFCAPEKTDATSKEDDTELQSGCFDLSFSPLSQELSNDSMNDAEPAPIPPVLDKVEDHAVNLKKTPSHGVWDNGNKNAQFETQCEIHEDGSTDSVLQRKKHIGLNVVCGNRDQEDKLSIKCRKEEPAKQCSETKLNKLNVEVNLGTADTNAIHAEDKHSDKSVMYDSKILNSVQSEVTLRKMVQTHKGSLIHCNPTCLELDFISPAVDNSVKTAACFELSSPKLNDSFGNSLVDTEEIKCHDQILAGNISQNEEDRCEGTVISSICTEEYRTFGQVCETKGNNANGKETGPKNGDKSLVEKNQDGGVQGLANVTFVPKTVAYEKESFEARETTPSWKTLMDIDISPEDVFTCRSSQFEESRSVDKFTHPTAKDNERLGNQECGAEIMLRGPCKDTSSNLESFVTKGKISLQDVSHAAKNGDDNNSSISQKSKSSTRDVTIPLSALSLPSSSASLFTDSNNTFKSMLKETNTITQLESRKLCSNLHVESHTEHLSLRENSSKTTSSSDFSCYHETEADNPSHSFGNKCPPELSSALDDAAMVECFHHSNLSYCKQECKSSLEAPLPEVKDGKSTTMHTPVYQSFQTVSDVMDSEGCVLHSFPSREKDSQQSAMSSPRLGQAENLDESPLTNMQGGLVLEGQNINPSSGSINPFVGLDDVEEPEKQNIAEVVSAKLTGYKVQGMVSSDIVRRHMSPRPATSNMRRSLLSLPIYDRWTQRDAGTENVDPEKLRIWSTLEVECNENKEINNMVDLFSVKRNNDTPFHSWCHQRNNDGFRCIHEQKSEKILDYWNSKATDHSLCLMPPHEGTVCLSLAEPGDVKNRNVKSPVTFHLKPKSPSMSTPWTPEAKLQSFSDADSEDPDKSFFLDQNIGRPHLVKSPHISMQFDTVQNFCHNHERSLQIVPNAIKDINHMMDASQKHDPPLVSVGDQYSKFTKRGISIWSPQHASLSELSMQVCGRKHSAGTLSPKVPEFEVHDKDAETNIKCLDSTQTSLKPETSDVGGASHPLLSLYSGCKDFTQKQGLQRCGYTGQQNLSVNGNIGRNLSSRIYPFGTKTSVLELTREGNSSELIPTQRLGDIQTMHTSEAITEASATMLGATGSMETIKEDGNWKEESKVPGSFSLEKAELADLSQDVSEIFSDSDFGDEACVRTMGKVEMGVNPSSLVDRSSSSDMDVQRRKSKAETAEGSPVCLFSGLPKREKETQNTCLSPLITVWNDALDKSLHDEGAYSSYKGKVHSKVGYTVPQGTENHRNEKINSPTDDEDDDDAVTVPDSTSLKLKASRLLQKFPLSKWTSCGQIKQNKVDYQPLGHAEKTARNFKNSSTDTCLVTTETDVLLLPSAQPDSPPLDLSPTHLSAPDTSLLLKATSLTPLHDTWFQEDQAGEWEQTTYGVQGPLSMGSKRSCAEVEASRKIGLPKFKKPSLVIGSCWPSSQQHLCHELLFPNKEDVENQATPLRQIRIPTSFDSALMYKNTLIAAVTEKLSWEDPKKIFGVCLETIEHLNVQLFDLAKSYHSAMAGIDLSEFTADAIKSGIPSAGNTNPACKCGIPSKVVQVKKEGPNKGRLFYACPGPRDKQCKWLDQTGPVSTTQQQHCKSQSTTALDCRRTKLGDGDSIMTYCQGHRLSLYCQCLFVIRAEDRFHKQGNHQIRTRQWDENAVKKNIYIKLPKKISSSLSAKDDLWIISRSMSFGQQETFIARSTFHGPNANGEVAVEPLNHFLPSAWNDGCLCYALHAGNAATELGCIINLQEHVNMTTLPILPHLLTNVKNGGLSKNAVRGGFKAPLAMDPPCKLHLPAQYVKELVDEFIANYKLNHDQGTALQKVADMMNKESASLQPMLLVHGVFGAGKSFLLSVLILFVVELFQRNESYAPGVPFPWKLLLSSTTNVAVDRVLQGLLDLGFEDFVRVGSVKKIAKPVLPYSVHATGTDSQELKDLQEMLLSSSITPAEKHFVKKSIERHRLGENRKRLGAVRVVGVTCAAASFQCLDKMQFPFVVLDEASQMTEPASLLPIARFGCENLVLVGDPKQLDPTLQGSEPAHSEGLEQTLFDRLIKMGCEPVVLRTQYRCHPVISAIANTLFYHDQLVDGITALDRQPLLDLVPTLCFYDVSAGQERSDSSGSFFNEAEARFVVLLLKVLLAQGMTASTVGVVTLYKAQAFHIKDIIRSTESNCEKEMLGVQVSTVDAFQGGERNVIILSCVRTRSLGFIDSDKRMNVALTRARHHLLIVGNQRNLTNNVQWATVIKHCEGQQDGIVAANKAARRLEAILEESCESHITKEKDSGPGSTKQTISCPARARNATPTQAAHPYDLELQEDVSISEDALHATLPHGTVPFLSSTSYLPLASQISKTNFMPADYDCGQVQTRSSRVKSPKHLLAQPIVIEDDVTSDNDELPEGL